ncbi:hypothetical protein [Manganibacter manganicus]|uniref:Phage holin family protein n=1 Tax=Manganibacter manganicus TaxID=1873176 RepID=A0A1V8RSP8_9HYPH|nr:hypothetical protein [Pseudaminobacter manganicus]OQM76175.1 hypothetical protein BFN67_16055 [Pseudaminobacter manganicus]
MGALSSLIAGLASGETVALVRRARWTALVYTIAALAGLCGIGFLIGACYVWTSRQYGVLHAAFGFGIGFLVLAGLIILVSRFTAALRARKRATQRRSDMTAIGVTAVLAVLPSLLRGKRGIGLLLAPAAALAAYAIYRENKGSDKDGPTERR